ncbi:MAG TPA: phosphoribosylglycinamide formyltransferase [Firmicutes bacterium]|nr:phosphoribosylglycinamide formyltransferase [Bacillota bacterium]
MTRVGVLVSGRGSNLQALLDACASGSVPAKVVLVISDKPNAAALEKARAAGVEALAIEPARVGGMRQFEVQAVTALKSKGVELVCLAGFMRVVSPAFLKEFPGRVLNIHPSLLPSFPGLDAQKQALEYGVKVTGCTVHFVDEQVDHGPIVIQAAVPVLEGDTVESLSERILEQEHKIYPEAVRLFATGRLKLEGRRVRILPPSEWGE